MRRLLGLLVPLALVLAATTGCEGGVSHGSDLANGKELFLYGTGEPGGTPCAACHTLVDAGSTSQIGPNLDDAFQYSRDQGFDEATFEQVVREQIRIPGAKPENHEGPNMPANLVTGSDADDVAYYVARCSGQAEVPNECVPAVAAPPAPPPTDGEPPPGGPAGEAG